MNIHACPPINVLVTALITKTINIKLDILTSKWANTSFELNQTYLQPSSGVSNYIVRPGLSLANILHIKSSAIHLLRN